MVNQVGQLVTYRVDAVRFQQAGRGAVLTVVAIDQDGSVSERLVLRVPGRLYRNERPFHVSQTLRARGREGTWANRVTRVEEVQIDVLEWFEVRPRGANWIDYVAASPNFKGIGRRTAEAIWRAVGADLFDNLREGHSSVLAAAVPGLGEERARVIVEGWAASGHDRLIDWLDERGLPRRLCNSMLRAYANQDSAVSSLTSDPYRLLAFGIPWKDVDEIARSGLEIGLDDDRRLHGAAVEVLMDDYRRGDTASTERSLRSGVARLLGVTQKQAARALKLVFTDGGFVQAGDDLFQLRGVHVMEQAIATDIGRRCTDAQSRLDLGCDAAIESFERQASNAFKLAEKQRAAIRNAIELPLSIVIGGAGTGKTACLAALHHAVEQLQDRKDAVLQMALAGRAAKRMWEATGREAVTIAGFIHTMEQSRIMQATHVIIDEASMLDVASFYAVLRRLKGRANLVLVGDDFQLPPVGSGKILHLLAGREGLPVTVLDQIWRQEKGNSIRDVARAVRKKEIDHLPIFEGPADGVFMIAPGEDAVRTTCEVFADLGGTEDHCDICVIAPRRRTGHGNALTINTAIHESHFSARGVANGLAGKSGFCLGDRFVCDVNHWDVDLMNGSLGRILRLATSDEIDQSRRDRAARGAENGDLPFVLVEVDGTTRLLDRRHLASCSWGYALTCHRAQGSDFERVIVFLDDDMDQSWLYTAITRGRRQVVLVGTPDQYRRIVRTTPKVDQRRVALDVLLASHRSSEISSHA
ncbi:MAG TPA: hypothetical protein DEP91_00875 [Sphingomonas bacterium]|jgi:exodeoxyribonuclease V alpha subunit|uniref:Uncharacterized protein n=1 Tax=Sphingomonas bacterium TaxID=1895847 RepID=A0A3D0W9Q2_9SPHN|nr:hypothetical protein [Sphingomonas bacterium]